MTTLLPIPTAPSEFTPGPITAAVPAWLTIAEFTR